MKHSKLIVSMAPHIQSGWSIERINYETIVALLPAVFAGWLFFGGAALSIVLTCAVVGPLTEALWQKFLGRPIRIADGSAVLIGILMGLLLSAEAPWWLGILGTVIAIIVGKELFGGLGSNPFSSVLVGWTFLFVSYHAIMESYPLPHPRILLGPSGYLEYPPLDTLKLEGIEAIMDVPLRDLLLGNVPGTIGTVSALAVLVGGLYLVIRRIVCWQIPLAFIASTWIFAFIYHQINPAIYASANFHIFSGWVMLGAFFLATEPGTHPVTVPGMILYGIGCGCFTMIIRIWGTYMEGVPFAILLMNGTSPLLDRIRPRAVGRVKQIA